ncbi:hypothetical protein MNEG_10656 [Monoraphidium neglectum]|uniref:Uncharacterized protein n=1 Tax=Monoraphidium neglectum TaxID=145388 RepID=A0A0D2M867_9CHLO|nr:hypothetical protein MNEG_10656 [Monoraphidium neglectum]KIY97306.1 hypothetical protein MNEG_10656 [Monoraphidium neglectum]|eukprot:XP_013896326.1 hypothetical protein MNEG_10656 [Monoraphidium neglectum]
MVQPVPDDLEGRPVLRDRTLTSSSEQALLADAVTVIVAVCSLLSVAASLVQRLQKLRKLREAHRGCSATTRWCSWWRQQQSYSPGTDAASKQRPPDHEQQQNQPCQRQRKLFSVPAPPVPPPSRWLREQEQEEDLYRQRGQGADGGSEDDLQPQPLPEGRQVCKDQGRPQQQQERQQQQQQQQQQQEEDEGLWRAFSFRAPSFRPRLAEDEDGEEEGERSEELAAMAGTNGWGRHHEEEPLLAEQQEGLGWDPELLQSPHLLCNLSNRSAAMQAEISSIEGLQRSPLYRGHVRSKGLTHEMATDHRLRIYRAMRRADQDGFTALLTRKDITDYEQLPPRRVFAALEPVLSAAAIVGLLLLPSVSATLFPLRNSLAVVWLAVTLFAASRGSASAAGWLLGIFETRGPHQLPASFSWVVWCCLLDCAFVVVTFGLGALPNAVFRLLWGQGVVERLLGLVPAVERSKPARIAAAPRSARPSSAGGGRASARASLGGAGGSVPPRGAAMTPRRLG